MTRAEKVSKLANAIREYRGATSTLVDAANGKWIRPPKTSALVRVKAWLERLRLDVRESLEKIEGFKTFDEFNAWLRTI